MACDLYLNKAVFENRWSHTDHHKETAFYYKCDKMLLDSFEQRGEGKEISF